MTPEVILFGLDGATFTVLDDLMARGIMPNLQQFCREGVRATMMSTVPPLTPPAWSTLVTGRTPGNHGVLGFLQYADAESNSVQIVSFKQLTAETIWSIANRQGARAGSLNFVAHHPAPKIDGWVIPGWVSWRWMRTLSHPSGVIDRLKQGVSGFDVKTLAIDFEEEHKAIAGAALDEYESWIGLHIKRERQWLDAGRYLLEHDPVKLFGIVFDGVDKLQHLLWPYLDPAMEPEQPGEDFIRTRQLAWSYFRQVDNLLGETVEAFGDKSTILICSDHGFTKTWELLYINTWLEQQGYLKWAENVTIQEDGCLELEDRHYGLKGFDLENSRAYGLTASSNGVYINVKGKRNETGIPVAEYAALREEIKHKLLTDCKHPETGEPLITRVWTREEAFTGTNMDNAPDLTVELRDFGFFSVRRTNSIHANRPYITGTHHPEGILIARGPGIRRNAETACVNLIDVAPTTLFAMGLEIPADLEGRVLEELFVPEFLASRIPRRAGAATPKVKTMAAGHGLNGSANGSLNGPGGPSEEDLEVLEKMKALGYLD
jgi:predicted AlkP superfamily phosphohydrolase/phosphomutase